jgi:hypothetical protein
LTGIYASIVDIIDAFLLCGSHCPLPTTSDQFLEDEGFDLSVQSFVEKKVLVFFGQPHIPELFSKRLVHILIRLSGYDFNSSPPHLNFKKVAETAGSTVKLAFNNQDGINAGSTASPLSAAGSATFLVGPDVSSPQREKAANASLELLFRICSSDPTLNGTF